MAQLASINKNIIRNTDSESEYNHPQTLIIHKHGSYSNIFDNNIPFNAFTNFDYPEYELYSCEKKHKDNYIFDEIRKEMYSHYPNHVILRSSEGNISYNPVLYPGRFITQEIVDLKYSNSEPPSDQVFLGNSSFIKLKPD